MNSAELKLKIHEAVDALESKKLADFYGILQNFINAQTSEEDWNLLSPDQQEGILKAKSQIENGEGIEHKKVMAKFKSKYA